MSLFSEVFSCIYKQVKLGVCVGDEWSIFQREKNWENTFVKGCEAYKIKRLRESMTQLVYQSCTFHHHNRIAVARTGSSYIWMNLHKFCVSSLFFYSFYLFCWLFVYNCKLFRSYFSSPTTGIKTRLGVHNNSRKRVDTGNHQVWWVRLCLLEDADGGFLV